MINLHGFRSLWGVADVSPFCLKLETYLRMAGLDYQKKRPSLRAAPKGKVPYIHTDEGYLGDSGAIIAFLEQNRKPLNHWLNEHSRSHLIAYRRLIEEHLYWVLVWERWDQNWEHTSRDYFDFFPRPFRWLVLPRMRRKVIGQLWQHGLGRHNETEINRLAEQDVLALSWFLADKSFFLGDRPTSLDASAYGLLANFLAQPFPSKTRQLLETRTNLVAFCERVSRDYFPTRSSEIKKLGPSVNFRG